MIMMKWPIHRCILRLGIIIIGTFIVRGDYVTRR